MRTVWWVVWWTAVSAQSSPPPPPAIVVTTVAEIQSYCDPGSATYDCPTCSSLDTSGVTSLVDVFNGRSTFNCDISGWDVSSVTDMTRAFYNAEAFNQDVFRGCHR